MHARRPACAAVGGSLPVMRQGPNWALVPACAVVVAAAPTAASQLAVRRSSLWLVCGGLCLSALVSSHEHNPSVEDDITVCLLGSRSSGHGQYLGRARLCAADALSAKYEITVRSRNIAMSGWCRPPRAEHPQRGDEGTSPRDKVTAARTSHRARPGHHPPSGIAIADNEW